MGNYTPEQIGNIAEALRAGDAHPYTQESAAEILDSLTSTSPIDGPQYQRISGAIRLLVHAQEIIGNAEGSPFYQLREAVQAAARELQYAATLREQAGRVDEGVVRDAARYRLLKSGTKLFEHYFAADYLSSDGIDVKVDEMIGDAALTAALAQNKQEDGEAVLWVEPDVVEAVQPDDDFDGADGVECVVMKERGPQHTVPLYLHAERARVTAGMKLVRDDSDDENTTGHVCLKCGHVPTNRQLRENTCPVCDAAPSQRAEVKASEPEDAPGEPCPCCLSTECNGECCDDLNG